MSIRVWRPAQINKIVCGLQYSGVALEVSSRPNAIVVGEQQPDQRWRFGSGELATRRRRCVRAEGQTNATLPKRSEPAPVSVRTHPGASPGGTNSAARFNRRALGFVSNQHAVSGYASASGVAEYAGDSDLEDDPERVRLGRPVPLGVALLSVAHGSGIVAEHGATLQR